jgi:hypothetical protein
MLHKRHSLAGLTPNIGGGSTNKGEQKRQLVELAISRLCCIIFLLATSCQSTSYRLDCKILSSRLQDWFRTGDSLRKNSYSMGLTVMWCALWLPMFQVMIIPPAVLAQGSGWQSPASGSSQRLRSLWGRSDELRVFVAVSSSLSDSRCIKHQVANPLK